MGLHLVFTSSTVPPFRSFFYLNGYFHLFSFSVAVVVLFMGTF